MEKLTKQALMYAENLTLPSFQVIVIRSNMGCDYCRQRVSQVMSKMTGLREYTVDVRNKQVMVKGDVRFSSSESDENETPQKKLKNNRLSFKFSLSFLRATFFPRCFRPEVL